MGTLIIGILVGILLSFQYAFGERELREAQEHINENIKKDLVFYKELSEKYEEELERERQHSKTN